MTVAYDNYYKTENLFGAPYPELIEFFTELSKERKVLDLGCGQGRDAIALARLGYTVVGVDTSKVGIDQMIKTGESENLDLTGRVGDIYAYDNFEEFDVILLDSMFHFTKKDREKEIELVKKILAQIKKECIVVICIQDTGQKVQILNQAIDCGNPFKRLIDKKFKYTFEDEESSHKTETDYRMIVVSKNNNF